MFYQKLESRAQKIGSLLCVGLDPNPKLFPTIFSQDKKDIFPFCREIIDATAEFALCFKPQHAYFASVGEEDILEAVVAYCQKNHPEIPVILDAKRSDIGTTCTQYAKEAFERFGADAVTVNPFLGADGIAPFTDYQDKGTILLCRTSNPSSAEVQELTVQGQPLYLYLLQHALSHWNQNQNLSFVVGATQPDQLATIRKSAPDSWLLIPGIGAQGGDLQAVLRHGLRADGTGVLISASRSIIYASSGKDFALAANREAGRLVQQMRGFKKSC